MIELLFYMTAKTLPFHLFAYVPFWNHLRFSKRTTAMLLMAEQFLFLGLFFLLYSTGIPVNLAQICAVPIYGTLFFYFVKMDWGKIAFLYIFTSDYLMAVTGVATFFVQSLYQLDLFSWQGGTVILVLFFLTMPFMLSYICRTAQIVFDIDAPDLWKTIWILPLFTSLIVMLFTYPPTQTNPRFLLAWIFLMVCMFLIYRQIIQTIQQIRKKAAAEEQARGMEHLIRLQSDQYTLIQTHISEIHRVRHDLRQHWRVLKGCIDSGDFETLSAYIRNYGEQLPSDFTRTFCQNIAVNAMVCYYYEKAEAEKISMEVSLPIDRHTVIPEPDFCVLLGNLLENAIEACYSVDGASFIRINAMKIGENIFALTVDNTCSNPPKTEQGRLLSGKHKGFGIGTDSVAAIARRYQGEARFEWKANVFYASVMLKLPSLHTSGQYRIV